MRRLLPLLLLAACAPDVEDPTGGPQVAMDFGGGWFDAPWPSEHLRGPDGVDVSGFPSDGSVPFVQQVLGLAGDVDGFGATSGVFFSLPEAPGSLPSLADSLDPQSPAFLVGLTGADRGVRVPVHVGFAYDPGPYGPPNQLALLPLQGRPLVPDTTYAAVLTRDLGTARGEHLGMSEALAAPDSLPPAYAEALVELAAQSVAAESIAGLAVFRVQDPRESLSRLLEHARGRAAQVEPFALQEVHDGFCVYRARAEWPVYQSGVAPYDDGGGTLVLDPPAVQRTEVGRLEITVPRALPPTGGWPLAVFVRTGGGGDRPLITRGVRGPDGVPLEPGSGPARDLAAAGWAGVSVDGPLGGERNPTGGDEQFLIFNVANPGAMRDNVRQSALELALLPDLLDGLALDTADCPDASAEAAFDLGSLALIGHSMGATIAPLTVGLDDRYRALVLSGAGGSWIHNVVHKQSPLEVRPLAEAMLRYPEGGWELTPFDPVLSMLQWLGESADPPVWGPSASDVHALMVQGIVDTYILPPMANATSLSLGLRLGGPAEDEADERLAPYDAWGDVAPLLGLAPVALPHAAERAAVVVQYPEDGVEDGHEVFFQRPEPKAQLRCFLRALAAGAPAVVAADGPCPD
jgi:hypothetical protein